MISHDEHRPPSHPGYNDHFQLRQTLKPAILLFVFSSRRVLLGFIPHPKGTRKSSFELGIQTDRFHDNSSSVDEISHKKNATVNAKSKTTSWSPHLRNLVLARHHSERYLLNFYTIYEKIITLWRWLFDFMRCGDSKDRDILGEMSKAGERTLEESWKSISSRWWCNEKPPMIYMTADDLLICGEGQAIISSRCSDMYPMWCWPTAVDWGMLKVEGYRKTMTICPIKCSGEGLSSFQEHSDCAYGQSKL